MDIKKTLLDRKFLGETSEISFDKILKEPVKNSLTSHIKNIHQFSLYKLFKLIVKRYLVDFLNLFIKEKKVYNENRSVREVKAKYEKISGLYIDKFYDEEKMEEGILKKKDFLAFNNHENKIYLIKGGRAIKPITNIVSRFCNHHNLKSLIEVGAGELTTLYPIIKKINNLKFISALDLSPNRLKHGKAFLEKKNIQIDHLIACDASNIPYEDNSFDISFTHYCIEQVPHLAKKIINEMIRISSKYILIVEPSYQFSNNITRRNILNKGFPKLNDSHFKSSKAKVIYRDGLPFTRYSNYAEITVLEKITKCDGKPILRYSPSFKKNDEIIDFSNI
ncbi:class I SAM-dependent methyltransferase [Candidatus Pelagibacter communis]|uniref:class I SAM-dependent methyltransferase n=1 Tax=Pelagibacter ubique TaxID=198252 RepID=UPI00092D261D|nr:class I SAM-dependent methyltransferase [Candidatus Pelagibacter ubique]